MKNLKFIALILLIISSFLGAKELDKVSLQLFWLDQFQFAGYYMAKEKGFYEDVGLDVELKKYNNGINTIDEVMSNRATYGIERSSLIIERSNGKKIALLASIFQSSPSILLARKDSNIKTIKDFIGKKVMLNANFSSSPEFAAMMITNGVKKSDLILQKPSLNINDLINKKTDLMESYITNEPFLLANKGVEYMIFDPKDYGFDFYTDILFTTEDELQNNHARTIDFKSASLEGWKYAFEHVDETIELILKKYNTQNKSKEALEFEAKALKKLIYYNNIKLGTIEKTNIQRIYDVYNILGFIKNKLDINELIICTHSNSTFTRKEEEFIKKKIPVQYAFYTSVKPFEDSHEMGEHTGVLSDIIKLIEQKSGLKLVLAPIKLSNDFHKIMENKKLLNVTQTKLFSVPYVLVAKHGVDFENRLLGIQNKRIGVVKNSEIQELLQKNKPELKPILVEDITDCFEMLKDNRVDGIIINKVSAKYYIRLLGYEDLEIFYKTKLNFDVKIALSKNESPELLSIIEKSIQRISKQEIDDILYKWTHVTVLKYTDWKIILQILGVVILIFILFLLHQIKLNSAIKEATKEIQEKSDNLNFLLDSIKEGIVITDEKQQIIDINNSALIIAKAQNRSEIIGKNLMNFIPKSEKRKVAKSIQMENSESVQTNLKDINGVLFPVLASGRYMMRDGQRVRAFVILDLTQIKQQEREFLQQAKLAQMGDMISMIAHQWRQPLNAISATGINLSLLSYMSKLEPKKIQESSQFIQDQCQKMSKTIDTFMNFVKPEEMPKMFKLSDTVYSVLDIMGTQLANQHIKVTVNIVTQDMFIFGFEDLLEQVLINLFSNARDAFAESSIKESILQENKFINITLEKKNSVSIISIEDNAGGIAENIVGQIFNPYFTTKKQGKGIGIGLYMSLDIMKKSFDGDLKYIPTDGGSCLQIVLRLNQN